MRLPARLLAVVAPVSILGAVAYAVAVERFAGDPGGTRIVAGTAAFLVASAFAERFPVPLEGTDANVSLGFVFAVAALVLFLANAIIRPIVIILTLPAVILTLGILLLFINAFTLWITDKIVPPFEVEGFWTYLGAVIIIWLVNWMVYAILRPDRRGRELTA